MVAAEPKARNPSFAESATSAVEEEGVLAMVELDLAWLIIDDEDRSKKREALGRVGGMMSFHEKLSEFLLNMDEFKNELGLGETRSF